MHLGLSSLDKLSKVDEHFSHKFSPVHLETGLTQIKHILHQLFESLFKERPTYVTI